MGTVFVTPIVFNPSKYNVSPTTNTRMDAVPIIAIVAKSIAKKELHLPRTNSSKKE